METIFEHRGPLLGCETYGIGWGFIEDIPRQSAHPFCKKIHAIVRRDDGMGIKTGQRGIDNAALICMEFSLHALLRVKGRTLKLGEKFGGKVLLA